MLLPFSQGSSCESSTFGPHHLREPVIRIDVEGGILYGRPLLAAFSFIAPTL